MVINVRLHAARTQLSVISPADVDEIRCTSAQQLQWPNFSSVFRVHTSIGL